MVWWCWRSDDVRYGVVAAVGCWPSGRVVSGATWLSHCEAVVVVVVRGRSSIMVHEVCA